MRVYELAKELSTTSKDLLAKLEALGIKVKNHVSVVSDEVVEQIKTGKAPEPTETPAEAAPEKKAPAEESTEEKAPAEAEEKAIETPTEAPEEEVASEEVKKTKKKIPKEKPAEKSTEAATEEPVIPTEPIAEAPKEAEPEAT